MGGKTLGRAGKRDREEDEGGAGRDEKKDNKRQL